MANETVTQDSCETYDRAHQSSGLMMDALTLIHAATDLNESGGFLADTDGLTDDKSRITSLLIQARDKAAAAIKTLDV